MARRHLTVEWARPALADLDRFAAFLHGRGDLALAASIAGAILEKVSSLEGHPLLGRPLDEQGAFREVLLRVANGGYALRYRVAEDRVVILRVHYAREKRD